MHDVFWDEGDEIGGDDEVSEEARSNGTDGAVQVEMTCGVDRRELECAYRVHAGFDGAGDEVIDVPAREQVSRIEVIGGEAEVCGIELVDDVKEGIEVSFAGAFADHDVDAASEFFEGFVSTGGLVIGIDAFEDAPL